MSTSGGRSARHSAGRRAGEESEPRAPESRATRRRVEAIALTSLVGRSAQSAAPPRLLATRIWSGAEIPATSGILGANAPAELGRPVADSSAESQLHSAQAVSRAHAQADSNLTSRLRSQKRSGRFLACELSLLTLDLGTKPCFGQNELASADPALKAQLSGLHTLLLVLALALALLLLHSLLSTLGRSLAKSANCLRELSRLFRGEQTSERENSFVAHVGRRSTSFQLTHTHNKYIPLRIQQNPLCKSVRC